MKHTRQIEINEGLFLIQPMESFSIHLVINKEENLIYCQPRWGEKPKDIMSLVHQLINMDMIQPSMVDTNIIDVDIVVWEIGDDTNELYIETYHQNLSELEQSMCEHDRVMLYSDFLKGMEVVN